MLWYTVSAASAELPAVENPVEGAPVRAAFGSSRSVVRSVASNWSTCATTSMKRSTS
jgi:hypothetical protein